MKIEEKKFYLTEQGLKDLKKEYEYLTHVKKHEIIEALQEARALGDLSENAEYHSAREEQGKIEGKIKEIEYMLEHIEIIQHKNSGVVEIGSVVTVIFKEDNEEEEYSIVGSTEADPFANKISNESPIATAILGSKPGDVVTVQTPDGGYELEIKDVK